MSFEGGNGAWDTRGATTEGSWRDWGRAGAGHAQDDFIDQGDSLRDCQAHNKHVRRGCGAKGTAMQLIQTGSALIRQISIGQWRRRKAVGETVP